MSAPGMGLAAASADGEAAGAALHIVSRQAACAVKRGWSGGREDGRKDCFQLFFMGKKALAMKNALSLQVESKPDYWFKALF